MFKELWKEMNGAVAEATREKLIELLEYYLNQKKPAAVVRDM